MVPAGVYLVGPGPPPDAAPASTRPVRLDRYQVTVGRYKRFLDAVERRGSAGWDHPDMPEGHTHQPRKDRLPVPGYYDDPAYDGHPAVAVSWWSAYAFARYEGRRLPSSLEWEAAARGFDGRLFPWGDQVDTSLVNCADSWSDHPLVTYGAWREEHDRGRLVRGASRAGQRPPGQHLPVRRPGTGRQRVGMDLHRPGRRDEAVVCGGSFDNPYRAVQASSKGTYRRRGASSVVGFRCAQDA